MNSFDTASKVFSGRRLPRLYHPQITVGQVLLHQSMKFPDKVMLISESEKKELSFMDITEKMTNIAENLMKMGFKIGDIAGFCVTNSLSLTPAVLGCFLLGVVISPVYVNLNSEEIVKIFEKTRPKIVFCDFDQIFKVKKVLEILKIEIPVVVMDEPVEGELNIKTLLSRCVESQDIPQTFDTTSDKVCAAILPCSGTTGSFKLARISHAQLLESYRTIEAMGADSRVLSFTPFFHVSGLCSVVNCLLNLQTKVITSEPFSGELCAKFIQKYKVTTIHCFPDEINDLVKFADKNSVDLSSVKTISSGGYVISESLIRAMETKLPNGKVSTCYGMTETAILVTRSIIDDPPSSSVGKLCVNTEAKILMDDGSFGGFFDVGEIMIRVDFNIIDYLDDEAKTKALIDDDTFLHTGDCGYFDDKMNLFIVGRKKFIIRCSNHLVHPKEIEDTIKALPGVQDVCVVAVADNATYECPGAVIQKPFDSFLTESDVIDSLKHLEDYKQLKGGIFFVETLPRTPTGKILRSSVEKIFYELKMNFR